MSTKNPQSPTVQEATTLRAAAAWLELAAEHLKAGDHEQAASMARLGRFGADGTAERIEALQGRQEAPE